MVMSLLQRRSERQQRSAGHGFLLEHPFHARRGFLGGGCDYRRDCESPADKSSGMNDFSGKRFFIVNKFDEFALRLANLVHRGELSCINAVN